MGPIMPQQASRDAETGDRARTRHESKTRLTRITGLHSVPRSLKWGGDTERGYSARDNETAERSQKGKVTVALDVWDD